MQSLSDIKVQEPRTKQPYWKNVVILQNKQGKSSSINLGYDNVSAVHML